MDRCRGLYSLSACLRHLFSVADACSPAKSNILKSSKLALKRPIRRRAAVCLVVRARAHLLRSRSEIVSCRAVCRGRAGDANRGLYHVTYVEVRPLNSKTSDYLYLTGNVRFRISGMVIKS